MLCASKDKTPPEQCQGASIHAICCNVDLRSAAHLDVSVQNAPLVQIVQSRHHLSEHVTGEGLSEDLTAVNEGEQVHAVSVFGHDHLEVVAVLVCFQQLAEEKGEGRKGMGTGGGGEERGGQEREGQERGERERKARGGGTERERRQSKGVPYGEGIDWVRMMHTYI